MKNLFKNLMLVAVAAMGFTACEQVIDDVNATNETFTVNIVGEFADDTRSGFDGKNDAGTGYKSAWDGSETVRFALIPETFTNETEVTVKDKENKIAGNSASFDVTFDSNEGTIHAFSPKGKFVSGVVSACEGGFTSSTLKPKYENAYVVVPAEQTPLANSVDPAAHILAGKADFAENVNMTFNHVVAYGKMQIKNFDGPIEKVEIIASESLAGISCKYFYNEGSLDNADVKTITLHPTYVVDNIFWFGCAPADLSNGTLTVKVYSGDDTYTKELNITGKTDENGEKIKFQFQQGHVASFGVNMAGVEADVKEEVVDPTTLTYKLVTDASTLAVGDKVIIVAKDSDVAMSTNQKSNNRGQAAVTKVGDIVTFGNDVQILTLETGTKAGTFAFNTGSGYLYAASSSSNNLKTQATNNDNGSWSITIATDGTATIKAQGTNTRNVMQHNQASSLFACYSSASQQALKIYKGVEDDGTVEPDQPGGGDEPDQPGEGGDEPEQPGTYTPYTENFTTWTENSTDKTVTGTKAGNACTWSYVGASKQYWSNISSGSNLSFAISLLKPGSDNATYVLSEILSGGIKNLKLTARSNNQSTGVNVYVIDLTTNTTHKVGTLNTTSKKTDFTGEYDLTDLNITGNYQIKIANKSTAAYCCIGGLSWNY